MNIISTNIESLAKYKAISLLGRNAINKLMDNGLVVINLNDLERLQADLHALSTQTEVTSKYYQQSEKHQPQV